MKDDNLQGADHFIHALVMGQKIWPNLYGRSVSEAAFVVHEERLKAQQEINRLQEEVRQLREAIGGRNARTNLTSAMPVLRT